VKKAVRFAFPFSSLDEKVSRFNAAIRKMIYRPARGPKQPLGRPGAFPHRRYGFEPQEFRRRVLSLSAAAAAKPAAQNGDEAGGGSMCATNGKGEEGTIRQESGTRLVFLPVQGDGRGARTRPHWRHEYRALARDLGASVEKRRRARGLTRRRLRTMPLVVEIVVRNQVDRGSLPKVGNIWTETAFLSPTTERAQKNDSG